MSRMLQPSSCDLKGINKGNLCCCLLIFLMMSFSAWVVFFTPGVETTSSPTLLLVFPSLLMPLESWSCYNSQRALILFLDSSLPITEAKYTVWKTFCVCFLPFAPHLFQSENHDGICLGERNRSISWRFPWVSSSGLPLSFHSTTGKVHCSFSLYAFSWATCCYQLLSKRQVCYSLTDTHSFRWTWERSGRQCFWCNEMYSDVLIPWWFQRDSLV